MESGFFLAVGLCLLVVAALVAAVMFIPSVGAPLACRQVATRRVPAREPARNALPPDMLAL